MLVIYTTITLCFISKARSTASYRIHGEIKGESKTRLTLFVASLCFVLFGMIVGFNVICEEDLEMDIDAVGAINFSSAILWMLLGSDCEPWIMIRRKIFFWVTIEEEVSKRQEEHLTLPSNA